MDRRKYGLVEHGGFLMSDPVNNPGPCPLWHRAWYLNRSSWLPALGGALIGAGVLGWAGSVSAIETQGVQIELLTAGKNKEIRAGEMLKIGFSIFDKIRRKPVSGLHPAAWIRPKTPGRKSCENAVRNYLALGPNASQDISLNGYTFVTLNRDNSIAVIDPRLNLATSNLLFLAQLRATPGDWRMSPNRKAIYITLPGKNRLLVFNPLTGQIDARVNVIVNPTTMAVFEGLSSVWVGSGSNGEIQGVDTRSHQIFRKIKVGRGKIYFAQDNVRAQLFAYASGSGQLIVLDAKRRKVVRRLQLEPHLADMDYSALTDKIYLAHPRKGYVLSLYPVNRPQVEKLMISGVSKRVNVSPDGRWLMASDGDQGQISLVETKTGNMTHVLRFKHPFDQIVFSKRYAYIRHTDTANISLIYTASLAPGAEPGVIEVPIGTKPPKAVGRLPPLPAIAPLPEGGGAVIANPADRTLYLYMESGMQAPMNAFKTWTAAPLSVMIHDRSLREARPGFYETVTMIPQPGIYEAVFFLPNPPLTRCFTLKVKGNSLPHSVRKKNTDQPTITILSPPFIAGRLVQLEFTIATPLLPPGKVRDISVLLFRPGSNWQLRTFAKSTGPRHYHFSVVFPSPGNYKMAVESAQLGLYLSQTNLKTIKVQDQ